MSATSRRPVRWLLIAGAVVSLVMAGVIAYYASPLPDGLESVAEQQGFVDSAQDSHAAGSPLADYGVAGVEDDRLSVGLAGLIGIAVTAGLGFGLFFLLRAGRRSRSAAAPDASAADGPVRDRG